MRRFAKSLALQLKDYNQTGKSEAILAYGLEVLLMYIGQYGLFLLYGSLMGLLGETALFFLAASSLRMVSGGAHNQSFLGCTLTSLIVLTGFYWLAPFIFSPIGPEIFILGAAVAGLWALAIPLWVPAPNSHKTIQHPKKIARFKKLSGIFAIILLTLSGFLYMGAFYPWTAALLSGMLWQGFTLTPIGYRLIGWTDWLYRPLFLTRGR